MNRLTLLSAAGLFSAALISAGCENMPHFNRPFERSDRDFNKPANAAMTTNHVHGADRARAPGDSSLADRGEGKTGSGDTGRAGPDTGGGAMDMRAEADRSVKTASATIKPAGSQKDSHVAGTVVFMPAPGGVMVHVNITGLQPNSKHGIHIHENGDVSAPDLKSAGGHFNPTMHKHGGPAGDERHGGDLGNITADDNGNAALNTTVTGISIDGAKDGIIGKSVILHAKDDDLKTDPAGNSGDRIAGGTIRAGGTDEMGAMHAGKGDDMGSETPKDERMTEMNK